jgi:beta-mannosidase
MKTIPLIHDWYLFERNDPSQRLPASVPGCVHTDLLDAGRIPDPWYRDNEKDIRWVENRDWVYTCTFEVEPDALTYAHKELVFEGLDTLCRVELNGQELLNADNMHRTWIVDTGEHLQAGKNTLKLTFTSPLPFMKARDAQFRLHQWNVFHDDYYGKSYVRKMACAFGWDWGLMAPTAGIWRPAFLRLRHAKIDHLHIAQSHADGQVTLKLSPKITGKGTLLSILSLKGQDVSRSVTGHDLKIEEPSLWWPNGMGDQPLYELRTELRDADGTVLDTHSVRLGLRDLKLIQEKDEHGTCFRFRVNGRDIFMKGGNWIPCDVFPSRISDETYRHLLQSCADSHMNMIRVWGGGIYEDERFYDLCDELGLLIWQDFMFACSGYPANDPDFMANVKEEAKGNVRRIHHRACLALWCGNNELEQGLVDFTREEWESGKPMPAEDYKQLFDVLLADVVEAEDGITPYWPSSGHTPGEGRPNSHDDTIGDAHSWSVWFGGEPIEAQRNWKFRFMSEFGFQSFPEPRTVESFTLPEERNLVNWVMDYHQRSGPGNMTIFKYILDWFPVPQGFENTLWMTQMIQALCVQVAAEHARRIQGRMDGLLYWQINDLWPGATWSSIDAYGRWKALQYFSRRFFAPVMVNLLENHADSSMTIHASNHRPDPFTGTLRWQVMTCAGEILEEGTQPVDIPSQTSRELEVLDCTAHRTKGGDAFLPLEIRNHHAIPKQGDRDLLIWAFLEEDGQEISSNLGFFAKPKYWQLEEPGIRHRITQDDEGIRIELTAEACAPWTRLTLSESDAVFSDNFLHLIPGHPRKIHLSSQTELTVEDVEHQLHITPLRDCWTS